MIEIVYSDVMGGTLLASGIVDEKDCICLVELMLDVGFIDKDYNSEYRRSLYCEMYAYSYPDLSPDSDDGMGEYFDASVESINKMKARAATGEAIRIWADSNAHGQCGLEFISNILLKTDGLGEVNIVYQPRFNFMDKSIYSCHNWGQFDQENANAYIPLQRIMTKAELQFYSDEWERLKKENSILRTLICNRLESVSEDFYDNLLLNYVSDEPISEKKAICDFLGDKMYGLSSLLPGWRIQKLIDKGDIEVVENSDSSKDFLSRKIKRMNSDVS